MSIQDSRSPIAVVPDSDPRWDAWRVHRDVSARDSLIEAHIDLLDQCAAVVKSTLPQHVEYDDLWSAGVFGLIQAVENYDPSKASFRTFAVFQIKNRIYDSMRASDWAPSTLRRRARAASQWAKNFTKETGRTPTEAEIEDGLGKPRGYLKELELEVMFSVPVRMPEREEDAEPERGTVEDDVMARMLCSQVDAWLGSLENFDQICWVSRYYLDLTVAQTARRLGTKASTVSGSLQRTLVSFGTMLDDIRTTGFDNTDSRE